MPRTNRNNDINYTVVSLTNTKDNIKLLDLTTTNNFRNYKWSVKNSILNDKKKTDVIINQVKKYNLNDFKFGRESTFFGKHKEAVVYLNKLADELGVICNKFNYN